MSPKHAAIPSPAGKILSRSETIAQLARRSATITVQSGHRRSGAADNVPLLARTGAPAAVHKFRTGQTVTLLPNHYGSNRLARFQVISLLPQEHGANHYRLKSVADGHERVATEDELI